MLFLLFLLPIAGLVTKAFVGNHCQDGQSKPCTRGCSWGLQRDFNGVANRVLSGHGYRNLTVPSRVLCVRECFIDDRCFSLHYSEGERRCELNGATASRYLIALTGRAGTKYYGPEEARLAEMLRNEDEVPLSLTDCWYHTYASAVSDCGRTDQHLCFKWELDYAYKEGYQATPGHGSWYADPDSLALLTETELTYRDLPLTAPSPGLCCSIPVSYRQPFLTPMSYVLADRTGQISGCSALAAHLCTLAELKEAYDHGYRSGRWYYLATPNRDASVVGCDIYHTGSECYQGTIANTPRPQGRERAYCCPNRD